MANIKDGISNISKDIEETIQKEIQGIMEEASDRNRQIMEKSNEKAEKEIEKINSEINKIIENEKNRINSLIRLETKRKQLFLKNELIDEVFLKIKDKLASFLKNEHYLKLLKSYILQGIEKIIELIKRQEENPKITLKIKLKESDKDKISGEWIQSIEKKYQIKLILSPPIQTIGGSVICTEDETISFDNTFEGRISRKNTELRIKIASILFPGDETA